MAGRDRQRGPSQQGRRGQAARRRRRAQRRVRLLLTFTVLAVLVGGAAAWWSGGSDDAVDASATASPPGPSSPAPAASEDASPSRASKAPTTPASPRTTKSADKQVSVPKSGPGTFKAGKGRGSTVGGGTILTYRVQVEDGIQISADQAVDEVAKILADPRSWAHDGKHGFRQVSSGTADLVIRIATPDTADSLCLAAIHMDTGNELNCEVPGGVVVNLRRWILGSPTFTGPISDYRALIINHEVGHSLGHGHEGCPGPGKLAPAMMQQIKGLNGCKPNAWPYDRQGHYISGPSVT